MYNSIAPRSSRNESLATASFACFECRWNWGTTIAARIPNTATTIINSTSEKALFIFIVSVQSSFAKTQAVSAHNRLSVLSAVIIRHLTQRLGYRADIAKGAGPAYRAKSGTWFNSGGQPQTQRRDAKTHQSGPTIPIPMKEIGTSRPHPMKPQETLPGVRRTMP